MVVPVSMASIVLLASVLLATLVPTVRQTLMNAAPIHALKETVSMVLQTIHVTVAWDTKGETVKNESTIACLRLAIIQADV